MNDLSLHVIDIIQNSVSAGATLITLAVEEDTAADVMRITIEDNGRGMNAEQVARLDDPFFTTRTTRRVGMGIPLLRQTAEQSGGSLTVESQVGKGTRVSALLGHSNIDRPPLGDIANCFVLMASANPDIEFVLDYTYDGRDYRLDTTEVKEILDGIPINTPSVIRMLQEMVAGNIEELKSPEEN